jgi:ArsR family transcriptional regulator
MNKKDEDGMIDSHLYELHANICKALGHPKRLELLDCLRGGEKSVKELAVTLGVSQGTLSRYLAVLHPKGIIIARREGPKVYYRLSNLKIIEACEVMREVLQEHLKNRAELAKAAKR